MDENIKELIFESGFVGSCITLVLILILTPAMYENQIYTKGHYYITIIFIGIIIYKIFKIKNITKQWKKQNISSSDYGQ